MKQMPMFVMLVVVVAALVGCASRTKIAQVKTIEAGGQKFDLGGTYDPAGNELVLTINGDPVMRGSFPPYTPALRLNATYKNQTFAASCYFGTILSGGSGKRGIIASRGAGRARQGWRQVRHFGRQCDGGVVLLAFACFSVARCSGRRISTWVRSHSTPACVPPALLQW